MTMKKRFLVFAMIACILGLTACGSSETTSTATMTPDETNFAAFAEEMCSVMDAYVSGNTAGLEQYMMYYGDVMEAAKEGWIATSEELGQIVEVKQATATTTEDGFIAEVAVKGNKTLKDGSAREATVVIEFDQESGITITENLNYTMGELMVKAALNTLLGMGTVFAVLILISFIIASFTLIPKVTAAFSKKSKEDVKAEAVDNTIAQIAQKEEAEDDLELIAVISAAIAASEGAASADGYVVRSIIRR